jgi:hypothetical protein
LHTFPDDLNASLSRTGILHPPIVTVKDVNRFEIVCGYRRLLFASSSRQAEHINCHILDDDTPPASLLDIVLTDQSIAHPLSLAEKARFVKICTEYLDEDQIIECFFDRLQLAKRRSTLATLLEILSQPPLLVAEIHNGSLQEKRFMEILRLPAVADRVAMVKLFTHLSMNDGKQKKFLPLIRDLAFRLDTSIAAYLDAPTIQDIFNHPEMNTPQKVQHLATFLQCQTNPLSSQAEDEFLRKVRALRIPENCTIAHSPSFEKDEVTLSITFSNLSNCEQWLPLFKQSLT